ncbi:polysaccharide deacetylase family protein [Amycolatopsis sp. SID8362]|uniref:polysaccharide deacetylase family protein n=1 Tax=Amycolatopsis sp. SID8362 TaxID=2690346 RepID=UPI001368A8F7|nr:polysaccharide deacetylase family protein [Amycolatopsis sp. SID8362]NBH08270.1 polysaccharide deacetylase family protein [Amycolatopsis sp. SID8362]NED44965.1 polysaccharide deacetylase family protein [Amycolatopsis sp. SID8362]
MTGPSDPLTRRRVLGLALGAATLTACSPPSAPTTASPTSSTSTPPSVSATPSQAHGPAAELVRSESGRPQVALTFHGAGDPEVTRRVLDVVRQHDARITVLAVGTWLAAHPDAARMVRDGGHELGNHTWSHPALSGFAPAPMYAEIQRCRDKLAELTGLPGSFFRQSQGQHATHEELVEAGKAGYAKVLSYDVDSLDWKDPGPAAIRAAVAKARAGSVVSMHLGHPGTVAALPGILSDLLGRGLTPVTASELLG